MRRKVWQRVHFAPNWPVVRRDALLWKVGIRVGLCLEDRFLRLLRAGLFRRLFRVLCLLCLFDTVLRFTGSKRHCDWVGLPPGNAAWPATRDISSAVDSTNGSKGDNDIQELKVLARMVRTVFRYPFRSAYSRISTAARRLSGTES
jgi:hypothetical protein